MINTFDLQQGKTDLEFGNMNGTMETGSFSSVSDDELLEVDGGFFIIIGVAILGLLALGGCAAGSGTVQGGLTYTEQEGVRGEFLIKKHF